MSSDFKYTAGLHNVGSYQVSGIPFATGGITAPALGSEPLKIQFPFVTRWFTVVNTSNNHLRFGFSANGVSGSNYFISHEENHPTQNGPYEMKITELYLLSDDSNVINNVAVMAGLTNIPVERVNNISPSGSNWSGSSGVG